MISLIRAAWQEEMRVPMFVGLSTDGYPDSDDPAMKNGARCYHMDTGAEYEYSVDDDAWYPIPSGGGGGDMTKAVYDPDNAVADAGGISQYVEVHGLPDASELPDGTAAVVVNGEWKMQEGYGYIEEGNFTAITWDGDTEGRDAIYAEAQGQRLEMHYKVSDLTFTKDSVLGGKVTMGGVDYNIHDFNIVDNESDDYISSTAQFTAVLVDALAVISCNTTGIIRTTQGATTIEYHCPTTGIYFLNYASLGQDVYVSSLTYGTPSISHPIDHTLMPKGYGYYGDPAFEPITWDGNTEGREAATTDGTPVMYKVSDVIIQSGDFIGAIIEFTGGSFVVEEEYLEIFDDATIAEFVFSGKAGEYASESLGVSLSVPEDGTYFYNADSVLASSLTAPASVHQFDSALIPSVAYDDVTIGLNAQGQLEVKTSAIPTIQAMNDAIANAIGNAIGGSY